VIFSCAFFPCLPFPCCPRLHSCAQKKEVQTTSHAASVVPPFTASGPCRLRSPASILVASPWYRTLLPPLAAKIQHVEG
jgi:hypothetical protein